MIEGAAAGREEDLDTLARVYLPVIRKYLEARWRAAPLREEIDDAVQTVFVDCLREGRTPETICTDNIKSLAMVFSAIESAEKGRTVKVRW